MSKPKNRTSTALAKPEAATFPALRIGDHFPAAIDLRPYTPELLGDTFEHHVSSAIAATFARRGTPLPFVPSPEHLAAIGVPDGVNQYGVRELGVKIGEPPTEYDLEADAIKLKIERFSVTTVNEICAAFAAGYAVRIGDAFLVAYCSTEDGFALALTNGSAMSGKLAFESEVQVWKVERS